MTELSPFTAERSTNLSSYEHSVIFNLHQGILAIHADLSVPPEVTDLQILNRGLGAEEYTSGAGELQAPDISLALAAGAVHKAETAKQLFDKMAHRGTIPSEIVAKMYSLTLGRENAEVQTEAEALQALETQASVAVHASAALLEGSLEAKVLAAYAAGSYAAFGDDASRSVELSQIAIDVAMGDRAGFYK